MVLLNLVNHHHSLLALSLCGLKTKHSVVSVQRINWSATADPTAAAVVRRVHMHAALGPPP